MPIDILAAASTPNAGIDMTGTWMGMLSLAIFFAAYVLIISEEAIRLRKSKPIMVAAGFIRSVHTLNGLGPLHLVMLRVSPLICG